MSIGKSRPILNINGEEIVLIGITQQEGSAFMHEITRAEWYRKHADKNPVISKYIAGNFSFGKISKRSHSVIQELARNKGWEIGMITYPPIDTHRKF